MCSDFTNDQTMKRAAIKNRAKEAVLFKTRLFIVLIIIIMLIAAMITRLIYLQVDQHHYYTTLSRQNAISLNPIPPKRGLIYDANHVLLANDLPSFSLMVTRTAVSNFKDELARLKQFIPISPMELKLYEKEAKGRRSFDAVPLKEKLTDEEVARFEVNRYQFPGFEVSARMLRSYPTGDSAAHVVGYMGRINASDLNQIDTSNYAATNFIGKSGIEKYFESQLHGKVGYEETETTADGSTVRHLGKVPAQAGVNLYLTIDTSLQKATLNAFSTLRGAAVAIDPNNGKILALVSSPSFDPNVFINGLSQDDFNEIENNDSRPLYNRAITGLYAPGSTIKPFIALQALSDGVIKPDDKIYDPGWYRIKGTKHIFHNWNRGGFGWVDLHDAIILSDDTYFYQLAHKLGIHSIDKMLTRFGFGQKTGIELPGEQSGVVPSPKYKMGITGQQWYDGDTVITGIGQGFTEVTPLQLAEATATIAMHGKRFQPQLLSAYQLPGSPPTLVPTKPLPPVTLKNPKAWPIVIQAMRDVVKSPRGTGFRFGRTPYTVAAKTGTAQVFTMKNDKDDNTWLPERERDNSLFIAFAPIDHPQIAVAIVVENNPNAPDIARQMINYYLIDQHHWHDTSKAKTNAKI